MGAQGRTRRVFLRARQRCISTVSAHPGPSLRNPRAHPGTHSAGLSASGGKKDDQPGEGPQRNASQAAPPRLAFGCAPLRREPCVLPTRVEHLQGYRPLGEARHVELPVGLLPLGARRRGGAGCGCSGWRELRGGGVGDRVACVGRGGVSEGAVGVAEAFPRRRKICLGRAPGTSRAWPGFTSGLSHRCRAGVKRGGHFAEAAREQRSQRRPTGLGAWDKERRKRRYELVREHVGVARSRARHALAASPILYSTELVPNIRSAHYHV